MSTSIPVLSRVTKPNTKKSCPFTESGEGTLKFVKENSGTNEQLHLFPALTSQSSIIGNEQELTSTLSTHFTVRVCVCVHQSVWMSEFHSHSNNGAGAQPLVGLSARRAHIFVMLYLYFVS